MRLRQALSNYFTANLRIRSGHTRRQYEFAVDAFERALGRAADIADLSDDSVRAMMRHLIDSGRSATTANDRRIQVCALWIWLCKRNLVQVWPTVDPLPQPRRLPRAWTQEQLAKLLQSCRESRGRIAGIPARDWWIALHCVLWDSGARIGETLRFRWSDYDENSATIYAPAEIRKGGIKDALYTVMDDTRFMLATIRQSHDPLMFPGIGHISALYSRYRVILKRAGLPCDRYSSFHRMRRSHASWLKLAGGDATLSLGHESDSTTRKSYLDPSVTNEPPARRLFRLL